MLLQTNLRQQVSIDTSFISLLKEYDRENASVLKINLAEFQFIRAVYHHY